MPPRTVKVAVIVVAFGENRNNIPNSEMWRNIQVHVKNMHNYACIKNKQLNVRIARQVSAKEIHIYKSCLGEDNQIKIIPSIQGNIKKSEYLGTREVLQLAEEALSLGGDPDELYIICHKDHKKRVQALASKLGINRINRIFANTDFYDITEPQIWCRYRSLFLLMEGIKILFHYLRKEI